MIRCAFPSACGQGERAFASGRESRAGHMNGPKWTLARQPEAALSPSVARPITMPRPCAAREYRDSMPDSLSHLKSLLLERRASSGGLGKWSCVALQIGASRPPNAGCRCANTQQRARGRDERQCMSEHISQSSGYPTGIWRNRRVQWPTFTLDQSRRRPVLNSQLVSPWAWVL